MKKRIFVAVNLPPETKKEIGSIIKKLEILEPKVKWIKPENAHFTLAFLGWLTREETAKITAITKSVARNQEKFMLSLENVGFFPSSRAPRVIWIGGGGNLNLLNLQNNLEKQLQLSGFKTEKRAFTPHLTIGRIKTPIKDFNKITQLARKQKLGSVEVSSIDVMESILKREGPEYRLIFKVNLKN